MEKHFFLLLTASRELKHQVYESLPTRRKALSSTIKSACKHRRDRPLPEPLPPPLSHNSFFESGGPYSTSDRDPTQKSHLYRPPSPIPSIVSLRGTDTSRGVKRKRTRDPPGPAPKRSCSQHNREKRRQLSINQFLPHGPPVILIRPITAFSPILVSDALAASSVSYPLPPLSHSQPAVARSLPLQPPAQPTATCPPPPRQHTPP